MRINCIRQKKWSWEVRERDGHKCQNCASAKQLHAHHILPWDMNENLRWEVSNGLTLCNSCLRHLTNADIIIKEKNLPMNIDKN
jgi:5-methylcytosine-specific restriction endonuclease McrA